MQSFTSYTLQQSLPSAVLLSYRVIRLGDRRSQSSQLEQASECLSHAVEYLIGSQLAGQRPDLSANREAISLLCSSIRLVAARESHLPSRERASAFLRKHTALQALRTKLRDSPIRRASNGGLPQSVTF